MAKHSRGFVYAISRTGITGTRQEVASDAQSLVQRLRAFTKLPIAVGFGVSTPEQFAEVGQFADAVVIGSAIVQRIEQNAGREAAAVSEFLQSLTAMERERQGATHSGTKSVVQRLRKSEIPRGLKPARDDKTKELHAGEACPDTKRHDASETVLFQD